MGRRVFPATLGGVALLLSGAVYFSICGSPPSPGTPRTPVHLRVSSRNDPAVGEGLDRLDALRRMRALRKIPMGGVGDADYEESLDRLRRLAPGILYYLEEAAFVRGETVDLRVDLVNLVAQHPSDDTWKFLSILVSDNTEEPGVRIAALEHFMKYRQPATLNVLRAVWLDPTPFAGRYHLCRALGECGQPGAVPLLEQALAAPLALDVRCHAALALGAFIEDARVRALLGQVAAADAVPVVRQDALQSLSRSPDREVDRLFREVAASTTADPETRSVAESCLRARRKER